MTRSGPTEGAFEFSAAMAPSIKFCRQIAPVDLETCRNCGAPKIV